MKLKSPTNSAESNVPPRVAISIKVRHHSAKQSQPTILLLIFY